MVNAFGAVKAALNPIAAVRVPVNFKTGSATVDAGGSVAACGATIVSYAWSSTGAVHIVSGADSAAVNITSFGTGTLTLVVADSRGNTDTATVNFKASGATTAAPASGGSAAGACVTSLTVTPEAPTVTEAFAPGSVAANADAVLTLTLTNPNDFDLTQSGITIALPAGLQLSGAAAAATTCGGANKSLSSGTDTVTLSGAIIPVNGSCDLTVSVTSAAAGTYTSTIAANDLRTGPAGGNAAPASAFLTVTAASSSSGSSAGGGGGGGGGGALDWFDIMLVAGVVLMVRGQARRTRR